MVGEGEEAIAIDRAGASSKKRDVASGLNVPAAFDSVPCSRRSDRSGDAGTPFFTARVISVSFVTVRQPSERPFFFQTRLSTPAASVESTKLAA